MSGEEVDYEYERRVGSLEDNLERLVERVERLEREHDPVQAREQHVMLDPSVFLGQDPVEDGIASLKALREDEIELYLPGPADDFLWKYLNEGYEGVESEAMLSFFCDEPRLRLDALDTFAEYYEENQEDFTVVGLGEYEEDPAFEEVIGAVEEHLERAVSDMRYELYGGWEEVEETVATESLFMARQGMVVARSAQAFTAMSEAASQTVTVGKRVFDKAMRKQVKKKGPLTNKDRLLGLGKWTGTILSANEIAPALGIPLPLGTATGLGILMVLDS